MSIFIFIAGSRVTPSPTFRLASVEVSAYPSTGPLLRYCSWSTFPSTGPSLRYCSWSTYPSTEPLLRYTVHGLPTHLQGPRSVTVHGLPTRLQGPCSGTSHGLPSRLKGSRSGTVHGLPTRLQGPCSGIVHGLYLPVYRALAQVLYNVCLIVITYSLQGPCSGLRRSTLQALWGNHMLNVQRQRHLDISVTSLGTFFYFHCYHGFSFGKYLPLPNWTLFQYLDLSVPRSPPFTLINVGIHTG